MNIRLIVLFVAGVLLGGCYSVPQYYPSSPVYSAPVTQAPIPQPSAQAPAVTLPSPPVVYQPVCYYPGYWVWNGVQNVCVYPATVTYYAGPGYYYGPRGVITFRFGGNIWHHGGGGWRRGHR